MTKKLAFLGLGAMGSRMAINLAEAGFDLTVWNRDTAKAQAFARHGTSVAATPRAAAMGADAVLSMVRDDDASARVWLDAESGALAAMKPGAIGLEFSTVRAAHARRLHDAASARKVGFLDAPVVGSRTQAESRQLIHLVGGDAMTLSRAEPILKATGAAVHHAGPAGAGASLKLAINALFAIQVAAVGELLGLLAYQGMDVARAVEIIGATPVASPAAKGAATAMLAGAYAPMFPVELVEKDLSYVANDAAVAKAKAPLTAATLAIFRTAAAQGLEGENLTAVRKLY